MPIHLKAQSGNFSKKPERRSTGNSFFLTPLKQRSGKVVHAWAVEGDIDSSAVTSNTFSMEWPPRSGRQQEFPEVDKGEWFAMAAAREKLLAGQLGFLDELERKL